MLAFSEAYKLVFVLHLVTVIIGFGGVFIAGVLGAKAGSRGGREGLAIAEAALDAFEHWAEWFIYAVPVLGILLVFMSDDTWKFSQSWIGISLLLYVVALGVVHGLHLPNIRRMNALGAELAASPPTGAGGPPPQVADLEARAKKAALVGGLLNLTWVVIVFLMVYKPGGPGS